MKILIIGGTGLIGRKITSLAAATGHRCTVLCRDKSGEKLPPGVDLITCDRQDYQRLKEIFRNEEYDVVVDQRCYNRDDAEKLWKAMDGRVKQYIFTSTCCVYSRPIKRLPVREDEAEAEPPPEFKYGYEKRQAEKFLLSVDGKNGTRVTIIRPSLTCGEGSLLIGLFASDYTLFHRLKAGKPLVCPGSGQSVWTITYTGDIASGYAGSFLNPKTYGQIYHMTSGEFHTWENIFRITAEVIGAPPPNLVYIPGRTLYTMVKDWRTEMIFRDKQDAAIFDNSKAKRDIPGFATPTPLVEIIRKIACWFEENPHRKTVDEAANRFEDEICELYRRKEREMSGVLKGPG